jgi:hypothetical protein
VGGEAGSGGLLALSERMRERACARICVPLYERASVLFGLRDALSLLRVLILKFWASIWRGAFLAYIQNEHTRIAQSQLGFGDL